MNLPIRLVTIADNGPEQVHEIASLQRTELQLETLGLTVAEGKTILREIQRVLVERQVAECLAINTVHLRRHRAPNDALSEWFLP